MRSLVLLALLGFAAFALADEAVTSEVLNPGPEPESKSPEDNEKTEDGTELTEGDMIIKGGKGSNRNAITSSYLKWPKVGGKVIVPYVLDRSLSSSAISAIRAAAADYAKYTCVRYVQRTNQRNYVKFFKGDGCYSYVGYVHQAAQPISIGRGCEYKGTAAHEMMHCIGFNHEQSRPDRDNYVTIEFQNVQSGMEGQFEKCRDCTTQNLPYDYGSVMHYGNNYFTKNGQATITPRQGGVKIGQRKGFTQLDVDKINKLYQC